MTNKEIRPSRIDCVFSFIAEIVEKVVDAVLDNLVVETRIKGVDVSYRKYR